MPSKMNSIAQMHLAALKAKQAAGSTAPVQGNTDDPRDEANAQLAQEAQMNGGVNPSQEIANAVNPATKPSQPGTAAPKKKGFPPKG